MKHLVILSFLLTSVWTTSVAQTEKQEQMVTGKEIVDKAKAYYANGWLIETGRALRQAWVMGEKSRVDSFLRRTPIVVKAIETFGRDKRKSEGTEADFLAMATRLDSLGFREGEFFCSVFHKQQISEQAAWDYIKSKQDDSFVVFAMADIFEMDFDLKPLNGEGKRRYCQRAADMGCILAYSGLASSYLKGWMHDGERVGMDIPKGMEYVKKAYEAGCLQQKCVEVALRVLEEHPEVAVPVEVRRNLYRMEAIDNRYWIRLACIAGKKDK